MAGPFFAPSSTTSPRFFTFASRGARPARASHAQTREPRASRTLVPPCSVLRAILDDFPALLHVCVAGGSPCQGLSRANPRAKGFQDPRSSLLWVFHAIASIAEGHLAGRASVAVVVENVDSMPPETSAAISRLFGIVPARLDAAQLCAAHRPRLFWSSYGKPAPLGDPPLAVDPAAALDPGWRPLWELDPPEGAPPASQRRFGTFLRPFPPGAPPEFPAKFPRFPLSSYSDNLLVYKPDADAALLERLRGFLATSVRIDAKKSRVPGSSALEARAALVRWIHLEDGHLVVRPLNADERDRSLGFPVGHSRPDHPPPQEPGQLPLELARCALTGNAWSPPVGAHVLEPLSRAIRECEAPPSRHGLGNFISREATLTTLLAQPADAPLTAPPGGPPRRRAAPAARTPLAPRS